MSNKELRAKLVIEADSEGTEEILKLHGAVEKLGASADVAAPEFEALAAELNKLGSQQAAINEFERLKQATGETAKRTQELQAATRDAALALKEKQAALAAASSAQQASNAGLEQARQQQDAMRAAVAELELELKNLARAAKESGDNSAAMAERLSDGRAQLAVLRRESQATTANVKDLASANRDNAKAVAEATRETGAAQKHFDALRKTTKDTQTTLDAQSASLQRSRDELGKLGISSAALAKSQVALNQGLDASRAALERMASEAEAAAAVLADRELLGVRAHADVQKEIDNTRAAYERLKVSGKLTSAELAQAALKTEERVRELQHQTNGWTESLGKAKAAFAGLAASGAGIAVAANAAIKFESAMADVAKVADGTQEQMDALAGRIKAMTATIPLAVSELAQIAAAGGQLGVPIEKLDQFIELAATMATAFGMSAEQAGQAVAKLSNVFGMPIEQVGKLGDAINVLGNTTAAREADIVDVLTRIGGTARQFGLTAEQAAALGTAMLSLGMRAEVAGTGINAILSKLQTASVQGKDFQLALAGMGVSVKQLGKDIRNNPQKALSDFLDTLAKLEGGKQAEVLARLFGVEYQDDVARLLAGLDGYKKALRGVADEAAVAGAMQKEFATRVQTTEAQIALLKNSVGVLATNLGSVLLPVLKPIIGGLANASNAMAKFAETFPLVSAAAAGLATAAASAGALGLAFAALRVAGTKSIEALSLALPGVVKGMGSAAVAAGAFTTALRGAAGALAAFGVGWDIGAYLRKEFLWVEQAGIAMAAGLTKAAAQYQAAWEMLRAPFNDDTIEAAQERLRLKLQQIDDEYAALFASAGKAKEAVQAQAQAAEGAAQANTKVSAAVQAVADGMRTLGTFAQGASQDAQAAARQLEQVFAQSIKGAQSIEVLEQLREKLQEAAAAGQLSADAAARLRVQLDQAGASVGAKELVNQFYALKGGAEGVQGAMDKLVSSLKFDDKGSIGAFATALQQLGQQGALSARQVGEAWQQALSKLSAQQIDQFALQVKAAFAQGTLSAQQFAQVNEQILATSFEKLGVNAAQALGKISDGAKDAINSVDLVAESAKAAGVGVQDAARAIEMAFAAAIPKADSLQAVDALGQKLKELGDSGKISAEGLARMQALLDKQRITVEQQIPGIQSLGEALKELGVKPQAELKELARSAKEAFDFVKASGTATPREINEAWKAMAEAAIEANNGVADASIKAQAQQHGFVVETDKAGKSTVKSMKEAEQATKDVGKAAVATAESIRSMGDAGWDASQDLVAQARAHNAALAKVETSWLSAGAASSQYSEQMAKVVWEANKSMTAMAAEHAQLVQTMESLARQQKALEDSGGGAAKGVDDLRLRLLELNGTEEQIARARHARDQAEVQRKIALMQIELQRAQINKKTDEAARLQQELALLQEQVKLLGEVFGAEERQRKAKPKAERQGGGGGGSNASQGGQGGGVVTGGAAPQVNITLNANGIEDPARLARMIEPELARMARLAR